MTSLKIIKKYQYLADGGYLIANLFCYIVDFKRFICFNYGNYLGINRIYVWVVNEVCRRRIDFCAAISGAQSFNTQECLS
jgi:hypothetical protein